MSAFTARSRDRAVVALRLLTVALVLLGIAATGALSGLFARQYAASQPASNGSSPDPSGAPADAQPVRKQVRIAKLIAAPGSSRHFLIVVHRGSGRLAAPASSAGAAPVVTAPQQPSPPASTSSGSDAS